MRSDRGPEPECQVGVVRVTAAESRRLGEIRR